MRLQDNIVVKFKEKVDEDERSIIMDYWQYEYPFYSTYLLDHLVSKYDLPKRRITNLVGQKSFAELFCGNCKSSMGKFRNRTELNLSRFVEAGNVYCENCIGEFINPTIKVKEVIKEIPKYYKLESQISDYLKLGLELQKWKQLDDLELETLIKITENTSKNATLKSILPDKDWKSIYNEKYWNILNKLEELRLIYIERVSKEDRKIVNFHYHARLYEILKEENPQLFLKRENIKEEFIPLKISIRKLENKTNNNQPDYSGVKKMNSERLFSVDRFYQFYGWLNNDNFKLGIRELTKSDLIEFGIFEEE